MIMAEEMSPLRRKVAMFTLYGGGVMLAITLLQQVPVVEPYFPASRGWVRETRVNIISNRDKQIADLTKELETKIDKGVQIASSEASRAILALETKVADTAESLAKQLDTVNQQQLSSQVLILESTLYQLRAELVELELKLRDTPIDSLLLRRKIEVFGRIQSTESDLRRTKCELEPGSIACQ